MENEELDELQLAGKSEERAIEIKPETAHLLPKPEISSMIVAQLDILLRNIPQYRIAERKEGVEVAFSEYEKTMTNVDIFYRDGKGKYASSALANSAYVSGVIANSLSEVGANSDAKQAWSQEAVLHMHSATLAEKRYYGDPGRLLDNAIHEYIACALAFEKCGFRDTAKKVYDKTVHLLIQIATANTSRFEECALILIDVMGKTRFYEVDVDKIGMFIDHIFSNGIQTMTRAMASEEIDFGILLSKHEMFVRVFSKAGFPKHAERFAVKIMELHTQRIKEAIDRSDFGNSMLLMLAGISIMKPGNAKSVKDLIDVVFGMDVPMPYGDIAKINNMIADVIIEPSFVSLINTNDESRLLHAYFIQKYYEVLQKATLHFVKVKHIRDAWDMIYRFSQLVRPEDSGFANKVLEDFSKICIQAGERSFFKGRMSEGAEAFKYSTFALVRAGREDLARAALSHAKRKFSVPKSIATFNSQYEQYAKKVPRRRRKRKSKKKKGKQ